MEIQFSRMYIIIHLVVVFSLFVSPFIFFNVYADDSQNTWKVTIPFGASNKGDTQAFVPNELPVSVGDTIVWENKDSVTHSITSGLPKSPEHSGLFFDLGKMKPGGFSSHVLSESDYTAFYYFCEIHPWMTGKIFIGDLLIAQPETETPITLEKTGYSFGENISISGKVHKDFADTKYSALIYNQDNDLVDILDGTFDNDASYNRIIETKGSKWNTDGDYQIKLVYAVPSKVAEADFQFSTTFLADNSQTIPHWIKNVGDYWCNGHIDDTEFVNAIQFLIKNGIIELKNEKSDAILDNKVPEWIKDSACWWANDQIPDPDFIFGIEYLVNSGIIRV